MIQAITATNLTAYISTEDNRIETAISSILKNTQIRHLVKFINDMDGSIDYCYPSETINNRYTEMNFTYNANSEGFDFYDAEINLLPAGHWKYEVYEVTWIGSVVVASGTAPATEIDILPVDDDNGVVQGLVTKGILNLTEKTGTEQVQYNQHESTEGTNYVYYGQ